LSPPSGTEAAASKNARGCYTVLPAATEGGGRKKALNGTKRCAARNRRAKMWCHNVIKKHIKISGDCLFKAPNHHYVTVALSSSMCVRIQ
jgi:hypothetical protein